MSRPTSIPTALHAEIDIRGLLGTGSRGIVWEGVSRDSGEVCAVKGLQRFTPGDAAVLKAEFRTLTRCSHPHIVQVRRLVAGSDHCWFEMDRITGTRITRWADGLGPSWTAGFDRRFRRVAAQLVSAICHVHTLGWLHRDIKPENILVDEHDRAVLFDFDLAGPRTLDARASQIVGTPGYRSPEQALGLPLGPSSDWYSMGAVLYEMLAGHPPYGRRPRSALRAQRRGRPTPLHTLRPELPSDIVQLVHALIDPEPARRPVFEQIEATFPSSATARMTGRPSRGTTDQFRKLLGAPNLAWIDLLDGTTDIRRGLLATVPPVPSFDITVRVGLEEQVPHAILDAIAGETVRLLRQMPRERRNHTLPRDRMHLLEAFSDFVLVPELSRFVPGRPTGAVQPLAALLARLAAHSPLRIVLEDFHAIHPSAIADLHRLVQALPSQSPICLIAEGNHARAPHNALHQLKASIPSHTAVRVQMA